MNISAAKLPSGVLKIPIGQGDGPVPPECAPALAPRSAEGAPRPSVLPSSLPMAFGIGCVATLAVFAIVHVRASLKTLPEDAH